MNKVLKQYKSEIEAVITKHAEEKMRIEKVINNKKKEIANLGKELTNALNNNDMETYKSIRRTIADDESEVEFYNKTLERNYVIASADYRKLAEKYPALINEEQNKMIKENRKKLAAIARNFAELVDANDEELTMGNNIIAEIANLPGVTNNHEVSSKQVNLWHSKAAVLGTMRGVNTIIALSEGKTPIIGTDEDLQW